MKILQMFVLASIICFTACGANSIKSQVEENEQLPATIAAPKESQVIHITQEQFKQQIFDYAKNTQKFVYEGGEMPCIVDFYATWCGPCKRLAPIMDDLSWEYRGKVKFYKIDTDKNRELSSVFQIRSIPTLMYVNKKGELLAVEAGLPSREQLIKVIEEYLIK
ncbi:MAG: thioredoxin [Bacteroidales bacterium]|nr:thioredoxin [Bacteroidales bacterium]